MQQYMLAVHMVPTDTPPSDAEMQEAFAAVDALNAELQAAGVWVFAGGLQMPDTAVVVRSENGQALVTDGPFAEAKEQLGGFWIINVPDQAAALDWAAKATAACRQPVEVRPFQDEPE